MSTTPPKERSANRWNPPPFHKLPRGTPYSLPGGTVWAGPGKVLAAVRDGPAVRVSWDLWGPEPPPGPVGIVIAGAVRLWWTAAPGSSFRPMALGVGGLVLFSKKPRLLELMPGEALHVGADTAHSGEVWCWPVRTADGSRWPPPPLRTLTAAERGWDDDEFIERAGAQQGHSRA